MLAPDLPFFPIYIVANQGVTPAIVKCSHDVSLCSSFGVTVNLKPIVLAFVETNKT